MVQTNREGREAAATLGANVCNRKGGFCQCNGCKTRRYTAWTFVWTMITGIGVWATFIF